MVALNRFSSVASAILQTERASAGRNPTRTNRQRNRASRLCSAELNSRHHIHLSNVVARVTAYGAVFCIPWSRSVLSAYSENEQDLIIPSTRAATGSFFPIVTPKILIVVALWLQSLKDEKWERHSVGPRRSSSCANFLQRHVLFQLILANDEQLEENMWNLTRCRWLNDFQ